MDQERTISGFCSQYIRPAAMYVGAVVWIAGYWAFMLYSSPPHAQDVLDFVHKQWVWIPVVVEAIAISIGVMAGVRRCYRLIKGDYELLAQESDSEAQAQAAQSAVTLMGWMKLRLMTCAAQAKAALRPCVKATKRRLVGHVQLMKEVFLRLKGMGIGIFLMDRWLKIQDVGSDMMVTLCVKDLVLCSNDGLWWSADWWWGHISLFLVINTFVVTWILTTPMFLLQIQMRTGLHFSICCVIWACLGPLVVLCLDFFMILQYPCTEPQFGWLHNLFRIQKVIEAVIEAPLQLLLQGWIFFKRTFVEHRDHFSFPWTLCFSTCTSMVSLGLTLLDIRTTADAQHITFMACFEDLLLVGLGRRAPLVHLLPMRPHVTYEDEGPLSDVQAEEISSIVPRCPNLQSLSFGGNNELSPDAFRKLLAAGTRVRVKLAGVHTTLKDDGTICLQTCPIQDMPPRTLQGKLEVPSQVGVPIELSVHWCRHIKQLQQLTSLVLGPENHIGVTGCRHIKELQQLTSLDIGRENRIGAEGCRYIKELQTLTSLQIGDKNDITTEGCRHIKELRQLTSLKIGYLNNIGADGGIHANNIGADGCRHISEMQQLTTLVLCPTNDIGAEGCRHLAELQQLISLEIRRIGADACRHIKELHRLTSLKIGDQSFIGADGCGHIKELRQLTTLVLCADNNVGAEGCRFIEKLQQLTSLEIGGRNNICSEGCRHLAELQQLTSLTIDYQNDIGQEGCRHLAELPQLTTLSLGADNHTGAEGCKHLAELQQLTTLSLGAVNHIGAEGCRHLAKLQQLTTLSLGADNRIGAEGCRHIAELQQLSCVTIHEWNDIGAEGCRHVAELQQLTTLSLGAINDIGADGCRHIAEGLPQLRKLLVERLRNYLPDDAAGRPFDQLRRRGVEIIFVEEEREEYTVPWEDILQG